MKLKDNYFDQDNIKVLESMTNGHLYSLIILKLYLKACKYQGHLKMTESIPYDPAKMNILAQVIGHDKDNAEKAINAGIELGLITMLESGEMWMTEIQNYIGHSSSEADRIREYRNKLNVSVQMYDKSTPEKEIKKKKEIDKEALEFTNLFFNDLMRINNLTRYNNKKPNLENWSEHLRLLNKINNVPYGQMIEVWLWAFNHHFWKSNILSTEKFREKYDALKLQMESKQPEPKQSLEERMK